MTIPALTADVLAGFPPPPARGIDLPGPFFLAFYTLAIMAGIVLAVVVATRLWKSRGGSSDDVFSAMLWAVLIGIVGARIYHVISSPDNYFGEGGDLTRIPQVWQGGLSIIGAVMAGSLAVWFFCRRHGIKFGAFADAVVPGVILAQAIGRWGNWFNQELFGRVTDLPWGLSIDTDQQHQPLPAGATENTLFHPTFLYESVWNLVGFIALILLFRRFQFRQGLIAWSYVAYYALGRFWIESLRIDEFSKSTQYPLSGLGLDWRLNQIIAIVIFVIAAAALVWLFVKRPQTEEEIAEHAEVYTRASREKARARAESSEVSGGSAGDSANGPETPPGKAEHSVDEVDTEAAEPGPRSEN
ncbi:prolipoprotein diacylglyceryl transferase [Nesterenkonia muleiensis]|uniref:prolipoprotein diacylglyceryl transferase n=1 Tax=Nesterenkonia muleiensis TaxID=2282648 RepID=UPI000E758542|nr:prolipoprotein diacylglyceryl transferase [Nesterenkonia muleiensis]